MPDGRPWRRDSKQLDGLARAGNARVVRLMTGVLLITKKIEIRPSGGREMLCKLNRDCLSDIFDDRLSVLELDARPLAGAGGALAALRGHIDGVNADAVDRAVELINTRNITCIFVDGSNLGEIAASVRKRARSVKIATFFHNVEFALLFRLAPGVENAALACGAARQLSRRAQGGAAQRRIDRLDGARQRAA